MGCARAGRLPLSSSPVVLFVHQVIAGAKSHQMGIVGRRRNGNGAGAAHVSVAQLIRKHLKLVGGEVIVVPEHVVVRRPAGTLHSRDSDDAASVLTVGHVNKMHTKQPWRQSIFFFFFFKAARKF